MSKFLNNFWRFLIPALVFLPAVASAQVTIPQVVGIFNIFVGLMLTAAFLLYGTGMVIYLVRLGTIHREKGIRVMEQAVVILFVLFVLLAIVQFFQGHPVAGTIVVSLIVALIIIWAIFKIASEGGEKKDEKKH